MRPGSSGPSVDAMPRYLVERTFAKGFHVGAEGAEAFPAVVDRNADEGVTWLHSYVSRDRRKTFCIYEGGSPEAIRRAADRNGLPIDSITAVSVLDPHFYR